MATNSGVRITRNTMDRALTVYLQQLPEATQAGIEDAMDAGAAAMVVQAEAATTFYGALRHSAYPGRHESGNLIAEFQDRYGKHGVEAGGGVYRIESTRGGNIRYTFGILDSGSLEGHGGYPYLAAQELGSGNKGGAIAGGGSGGIAPMMAVQAGFNVVASRLESDIAAQLVELGRAAEAGRLYVRARRQASAV